MGKSDPIQNLALNPSVSLTLNALATWVEWNLELGKPLSFQLREWPEMGAGVVSDAARTRMAAFFDKALPELQSLLVRFGFSSAGGCNRPSHREYLSVRCWDRFECF